MRLGKVVKSNSHWDYVVQLDDALDVELPPQPEDYGLGSFVKFEDELRHWAVGVIYNTQLFNPQFNQAGPRLNPDPDPVFTPDLVQETRVLLSAVLIGSLVSRNDLGVEVQFGQQGVPPTVVPINTPVSCLTVAELATFHRNPAGNAQFSYYAHLLRSGGPLATEIVRQIVQSLMPIFNETERRALGILGQDLAWRHTLSSLR